VRSLRHCLVISSLCILVILDLWCSVWFVSELTETSDCSLVELLLLGLLKEVLACAVKLIDHLSPCKIDWGVLFTLGLGVCSRCIYPFLLIRRKLNQVLKLVILGVNCVKLANFVSFRAKRWFDKSIWCHESTVQTAVSFCLNSRLDSCVVNVLHLRRSVCLVGWWLQHRSCRLLWHGFKILSEYCKHFVLATWTYECALHGFPLHICLVIYSILWWHQWVLILVVLSLSLLLLGLIWSCIGHVYDPYLLL